MAREVIVAESGDLLVDRIYEAGLVPDLWPALLVDIAAMTHSASGSVQIFPEGQPPRYLTTPRTEEAWGHYVRSGAWKTTTANPSLIPWTGEVFRQFVPTTRPELGRNPDDDFSAAFGLESQIGTIIGAVPGGLITFTFERELGLGPHAGPDITRLDTLRRHLARAAMTSARLGLERASGSVAALQTLGLPAAVLTAGGRVLASNDLLDGMPDILVARAHGGLALRNGPADTLMRSALAEIAISGHRAVRSIPIPASEERGAVAVHVSPLMRSARDILAPGDVLVVLAEMQPGAATPSIPLLVGLFDLTPAEARLAAALSGGLTLDESAADQGIRRSTARTYLGQIFQKTGTHQQSQLVALLTSARHPPEP